MYPTQFNQALLFSIPVLYNKPPRQKFTFRQYFPQYNKLIIPSAIFFCSYLWIGTSLPSWRMRNRDRDHILREFEILRILKIRLVLVCINVMLIKLMSSEETRNMSKLDLRQVLREFCGCIISRRLFSDKYKKQLCLVTLHSI